MTSSRQHRVADDPLALAALYNVGLGSKWESIVDAAERMTRMGIAVSRNHIQQALAVAALPREVLALFSDVGIVGWTARRLIRARNEHGESGLMLRASSIDPTEMSRSEILARLCDTTGSTRQRRTYKAETPVALYARYQEGLRLGAWTTMNEAAEAMRVSYWRLQIASEIVVLPPELTSLLPTESLTFETGRALVDLIALRGVNAIRQAAAAAKNVVPRLSPQRLLARLVGIDRAPFTVKVRRGTKPNGRPGGLFVEMHLDPSDADSENRLEMVANLLNMKFAIDSAGQSETFVAKRRADRKPQVAKQQRVDVPCPIERLSVSADMDGSTGSNRNRLHGPAYAENDAAALLRWLSKYENPATRERYRSETERLLLWATFGKGKPLSSLNVDDANEYINRFVVAPKPSSVWVTKGRRPRDEPAWRPFSGPLLSDRSRQKSLYVLKKCFKDLVSYGYLIADPFERISVEPPSNFRGEK